jgi:hypothetical protein
MATNVLRRRIDCFRHGHPGYSDWLAEYPHGYVLTLRGHDVPPILHRADCPHVSSRRQQHPMAGQCEKRCAPQRATLEQWIQHALRDRLWCQMCTLAGCQLRRVESANFRWMVGLFSPGRFDQDDFPRCGLQANGPSTSELRYPGYSPEIALLRR